jgi:hypothetical protein
MKALEQRITKLSKFKETNLEFHLFNLSIKMEKE